ncbi:MAG: hypothetical protein ACXWTL_06895 [Methylobacter sp.]
MNIKRRIFIVVKTYPTLSKKYDELVCTAGVLDDGSWVRIYPLPFRRLDYEHRYKKYQWIELSLIKNTSDPRPESYRVVDPDAITLGQTVDTDRDKTWKTRKSILFKKNPIYCNLTDLITKANANELSLAIFKPTKIIDFIIKKVEREWDIDCLEHLKERSKQFSLFDLQQEEEVQKEFSRVNKLPYKFSYKFLDNTGKESTLMIEDWEIGALYWKYSNDETLALKKVKERYLDDFLTKDIYLFLGTTRQFHGWANNPFVIVGVFYPPIDSSPEQLLLF